ncbi:MAG: hypothetical protein JSW07_23320 [bacterium]|nr:MAG: hypothetical protein JSW07_23320 [bacterium]
MKRLKISLFLLFGLSPLCRLEGHGYIFSKTVEEMRDQISIYVQSEQIMIQYQSEYLGQIAPHIRIMIDTNDDSVLTIEEVNNFFATYQKSINETLPDLPLFIDTTPATIELINILAPTIQNDSLLAPFKIGMIFKIDDLKIDPGQHELVIDPKLLFSKGDNFIKMAKETVDFTDEQEKAIGRFLQIKLFAADSILFTSTYPGYIKKDKKSVFIHGVFYDETILRIKKSQYPKLRVNFTSFQ